MNTSINLKPCYGTSPFNTFFYDKTGYQKATNKKEVCAVKKNPLMPSKNSKNLTKEDIKNKVRKPVYSFFNLFLQGGKALLEIKN